MPELDADVIVIGAGPTGLMLAGELRLNGVQVLVLDRLAEPMQQSRALGFSARTIEEFDQRGLLPRFGTVDTIPVGHFGGLPIDFRVLEGGSYGARGKPQSMTEGILAGWAGGLGAEVRREQQVTGLSQPDDPADPVEVQVEGPQGPQTLRARYVAGCDGARSTVRRALDIPFPGTDATIEMWFADVAGLQLRPRFSGERVPGGMVMVLPMGPQVSRVVVYERGARRRTDGPPSFEEVAASWNRLTGEDISAGKPLWTSYTTDASRQAEQYRKGRAFLLGDAAHIHLPVGAQGMSAGIGDAVNLGWKLAAVLKGQAPDDLLDTFHQERHPVGARILTNTLAQRTLYLSGDEMDPLREVMGELLAYESVQKLLVGMVTGLDIRYEVGGPEHPLLGRRVPDAPLGASADGPARVFDLLRSGQGVLLNLGEPVAVAGGWSGRVKVLDLPATEIEGLPGVHRVLIRPDGYIAWVADGPQTEGLAEALTRWFGEPGAGLPDAELVTAASASPIR
ncbi:FAD-dependent monooxygenase [Kineosporia babensis]|uniref:FAD-dependent monooxygenase n=1 Tax=Kineosporia babensis TaxID=499548 RepID=A0A9X1NM97_9ACTN|nr:FAD-dependent monooxygenase [Kineosporia babensis]MCD5315693.1 FAD-dependent monooxygenase [Kineosporia babensis]